MKRIEASRVVALGAIVLLGAVRPAAAQNNVKVIVSEVVDDRISAGMSSGSLIVMLNLEGDGLDAVKSARIHLKEAKDDTGRASSPRSPPRPISAIATATGKPRGRP